ncbi:MAG: hypothetical protein WEC84_00590 [Candidatus Andersenbacteria bacterium]
MASEKGYTFYTTDEHEKDAADKLMINKGCEILEDRPRLITDVVLMTGDTDFIDFAGGLRSDGHDVWIIMPGKEEYPVHEAARKYRTVTNYVLSLEDVRAFVRNKRSEALSSA